VGLEGDSCNVEVEEEVDMLSGEGAGLVSIVRYFRRRFWGEGCEFLNQTG
jgi:hypothetical protein